MFSFGRSRILSGLLGLSLGLFTASGFATNYYVRTAANGGNDANNGLAPASSFATVQHAAATVTAGDTVYVGAASTSTLTAITTATVSITTSGLTLTPISFIADTAGTFTGDAGIVYAAPTSGPGFNLNGNSNIVIDGFRITAGASGQDGILTTQPLSNLTIQNCDITGCGGRGIAMGASSTSSTVATNVAVTSCAIHSNTGHGFNQYYNTTPTSGSCTLTGNRIYSNGGSGALVENAVSSTFTKNMIYSNTSDGITVVGLAAGAYRLCVINNVIYAQGSATSDGINVSGTGGSSDILNNTVYLNTRDGIRLSGGTHTVLNNIITVPSNGSAIDRLSGTVFSNYNCLTSGTLGIGISPQDIVGNPVFADADGADNVLGGSGGYDDNFQLQNTSPCIDAGADTSKNTLIPSDDIIGTTRPLDTPNTDPNGALADYDMGAYEFIGSAPAPATPIVGNTYYIRVPANGGNNSNTGLAPGAAWATITKAAQTMVAGDKVYVGAGTYAESVPVPTNSGASNGTISFIADRSGAQTGDAGTVFVNPASGNGFSLGNKDYIVIDGFKITAAGSLAIGIQGTSGCDSATIMNCDITNCADRGVAFGLSTSSAADCQNILVQDCTIHNNGGMGYNQYGTSLVTGWCTLRHNRIYSNGDTGVRLERVGGASIGNSALCVVERNSINGNINHGIFIPNSVGSGNFLIQNNLIFGETTEAIRVGTILNLTVLNNTTYNCRRGFYAVENTDTGYYTVVSNIFNTNSLRAATFGQQTVPPNPTVTQNVVWGYNCYTQTLDPLPATTVDLGNSLSGTDPQFVNPAGSSFHLQGTSPAIDVGADATVNAAVNTEDIDGGTRPFDVAGVGKGGVLAYDIGADEFGTGDVTAPTVTSINRANPNAYASTLNFTVIFSEPVTGVTTGNFSLATTNGATGTISSVSGSGMSYSVQVTSVAGGASGSLGLNLDQNIATIEDGNFNPLATTFTGQTYSLPITMSAFSLE